MKQKIVIKVQMNCDKCRSKALKIAAVAEGVSSVAIEGAEKDQVVVIGDDVDSTCLTSQLRKKVGYANLVSVQEEKGKVDPKKQEKGKVEPKKEEKGKVEAKKEEKIPSDPYYFLLQQYPPYQVAVVYDPPPNPTGCTIM